MKARELDIVLDGCWTQFGRVGRFRAPEIAQIAARTLRRDIDAAEVGRSLQGYRTTNSRAFDVACEGYGTNAQWQILGVHGHLSTRRRQRTLMHKDYIVEDALKREGRDLAHEVLEALKRNRGEKAREECRATVLDFRSRCYGRLGATGLSGDDIGLKAEDAYAPVARWYVNAFGEQP